jgi:DNA polymerase III sliding clamp (beta) subunit (PCNA family)
MVVSTGGSRFQKKTMGSIVSVAAPLVRELSSMQIKLHGADYERMRNFTAQWNKRHTIPATRAVSYISDGEKVYARITNLQYWLQRPVFAQADKKGACVIPTDYAVSEPIVQIRQTKTKLTVNDKAVQNDEYEVVALPVPEDQLQPIVRCYRNDLIHALRFVLPAMCKDSNDQRIYGVRIRACETQQLLLEATDTHRLHRKWIPAKLLTPDSEHQLTLYVTPDLLVLLQQLTGTTVSLGMHDTTAYLISDRNELICWQHELAFPNTERVIPNPENATTTLRVSTHALRNAIKTLGRLKHTRTAKTYVELQPNTTQLTLTCAETKQSQPVTLYSEPPAEQVLFAIDRYFVEQLLQEIPSHTTLEITVYQRTDFALTEWRVYGDSTRYALISGIKL